MRLEQKNEMSSFAARRRSGDLGTALGNFYNLPGEDGHVAVEDGGNLL